MNWLMLIVFIELLVLFFVSKIIIKNLYIVFNLFFGARSIALSITTLILFPGTVVHELSHLFMAEILRVPTGKLNLTPEALSDKKHISTGSVQIGQSDPIRRYLIGFAPTIFGLVILSAISIFIPSLINNLKAINLDNILTNPNFYLLILSFYLIFSISNTMFSSSTDLKGFWIFALVIIVFISALYLTGFRVSITGNIYNLSEKILSSLSSNLGLVIFINIGLLIPILLLRRLFRI